MELADPKKFFDTVRRELFANSISQSQVDGLNDIVKAWPNPCDLRWVAYGLATAYHETARTMQPIAEYGKGKGKQYGVPAGPYNQIYYGRGLVQLTWLENYEKATKELYVDFVQFPDYALKPDEAALIMVRGMSKGWFTGKKLADYFNEKRSDWINARRIINGTDRAAEIGGYGLHFLEALS